MDHLSGLALRLERLGRHRRVLPRRDKYLRAIFLQGRQHSSAAGRATHAEEERLPLLQLDQTGREELEVVAAKRDQWVRSGR